MNDEPICKNCGERASNCDCWDYHGAEDDLHRVLAYRLKHKFTTSPYLTYKEEE